MGDGLKRRVRHYSRFTNEKKKISTGTKKPGGSRLGMSNL